MKFFGQFLLEKHVITEEQLEAAIAYQNSVNLSIGELAIEKDYLSRPQLNQILSEQRKQDLKFGELAVKLNFLKPAQIDELLAIQKERHVYIGEALEYVGALSPEALRRELDLFTAEKDEIEKSLSRLPEYFPNRIMYESIIETTQNYLMRMTRIFIKRDRWVEGKAFAAADIMVEIKFSGDLMFTFCLGMSKALAAESAGKMLGEPPAQINDALLFDCIGEILNVVCGNVSTKLDSMGINTELSIPQRVDLRRASAKAQKLRFDFITHKGAILLYLLEEG